ncbi:[Protein-PII] uridylyltransferase [Bertholletia excelsa]
MVYRPNLESEFNSLIERINPPRVCIDNDSLEDCTLVKVDSANKHGILLEMVQVLTDLDLYISKSYIVSDGGWLMDVFHVTDHLGNKITDESLLLYIQQAMCATRRERPQHVATDKTALEITGMDRPGLMSEISAVLAELGCHVTTAVAWTHNTRAACIIYLEDDIKGGSIADTGRAARVLAQLQNVVEAHHQDGERRSVSWAAPANGPINAERRLHQLMSADSDFGEFESGERRVERDGTMVTIDYWKERGYSVVNVKSRDRPKLLFDTVCALTDMQYVVFHAAISSKGSMAIQEYYIRHKDGCTLDSESERRKVSQCLFAAIERRVSHGMRLDVSTENRTGLLADVTRALRENGLSITRAEIGKRGEGAVGSFYVADAWGQDVGPAVAEMVRQKIGGTLLVVNESSGWPRQTGESTKAEGKGSGEDTRPRFSLGTLLWSQLERFSSNFKTVKS